MFRRDPPRLWAPSIALGALVLLLVAGPAPATESSAPSPGAATGSTGGPAEPAGEAPTGLNKQLRISGGVFRPRGSDADVAPAAGGGCMYVEAGNDFRVWNHEVSLPQGATVSSVRMYYDDTSSGTNSRAWFSVYDLYGALVDEWSVDSAGDTGNGFRDVAVGHTVDYLSYSYVLNWRPYVTGSSMQLCGFRIFYEDPNVFRDGFNSGGTSRWSATQP